MQRFQAFTGVVTGISNFGSSDGCDQIMSVADRQGRVVNAIVGPDTYVVDQKMIKIGDRITMYYDADAPAVLIYPPQYHALVIVLDPAHDLVKLDYFNRQLISSDGQLQLNVGTDTSLVLENGQQFKGNLANRYLLVIYRATTKSIPAQTTPMKIIVLCM